MGKRVLIDTSKLIDIEQGVTSLPKDIIPYISEITLYEFIRGHMRPKIAKQVLEEEAIIVWVDNDILLKATEIWRTLKSEGKTIPDADIIIAATAIVKNLELWTSDQHFEELTRFGLKLFSCSGSK